MKNSAVYFSTKKAPTAVSLLAAMRNNMIIYPGTGKPTVFQSNLSVSKATDSATNTEREWLMTYEEAVKSIVPGKYRHFKGNEYEVVAVARNSEDESPLVVYKALYGDCGLWVRPAGMWNEEVHRDGKTYRRFVKISD